MIERWDLAQAATQLANAVEFASWDVLDERARPGFAGLALAERSSNRFALGGFTFDNDWILDLTATDERPDESEIADASGWSSLLWWSFASRQPDPQLDLYLGATLLKLREDVTHARVRTPDETVDFYPAEAGWTVVCVGADSRCLLSVDLYAGPIKL